FEPRGLARLALILGAMLLYGAALWFALRRGSDSANLRPERQAARVAALLWLCLVIPLHSVIPKVDPFTARPFSSSLAPLLLLVTYFALRCYERASNRGLVVLHHAPSGDGVATTRAKAAFNLAHVSACLALISCLTLVALGHLTHVRATLYQDAVALWRDAALRSTQKTRPLVNLGTLLAKRGELRQAEAALQAAAARDAGSLELASRLGAVRRLRVLGSHDTQGALQAPFDPTMH